MCHKRWINVLSFCINSYSTQFWYLPPVTDNSSAIIKCINCLQLNLRLDLNVNHYRSLYSPDGHVALSITDIRTLVQTIYTFFSRPPLPPPRYLIASMKPDRSALGEKKNCRLASYTHTHTPRLRMSIDNIIAADTLTEWGLTVVSVSACRSLFPLLVAGQIL